MKRIVAFATPVVIVIAVVVFFRLRPPSLSEDVAFVERRTGIVLPTGTSQIAVTGNSGFKVGAWIALCAQLPLDQVDRFIRDYGLRPDSDRFLHSCFQSDEIPEKFHYIPESGDVLYLLGSTNTYPHGVTVHSTTAHRVRRKFRADRPSQGLFANAFRLTGSWEIQT